MLKKLIVILGPTASGKTDLSIKLARKFNGEVISADSRQVYKGMDIGTGKDIENSKFQIPNFKSISNDKFQIGYYEIDEVKVWLYDVAEPSQTFNVAAYAKLANKALENICGRKKLPILVGGTGFYIKAVVDGIETIGFPPDWELREKLLNYQIIKLSKLLKQLDPKKWERMNESDRENPRRLIRAVEVALAKEPKPLAPSPYTLNPLFIGLTAPNKVLYQRIDGRVEKRVKEGILGEIENLLKEGYSWEKSVLGETIGYKEFKPYFEGEINPSEAIQRWKYDEHAYARRQVTWFKKALRQAQGTWFDITKRGFEKRINERVKDWLAD